MSLRYFLCLLVPRKTATNPEIPRNILKYPEISRKIQRRHLGVWEGASIYVSSRFFVYPRSLKNLKILKNLKKIWKYLEKSQNPEKSLKQMSVKFWNVPKNILKARKIQNFLLPEISFKWFSRVWCCFLQVTQMSLHYYSYLFVQKVRISERFWKITKNLEKSGKILY